MPAPIVAEQVHRDWWKHTEPRIMSLAPDGWVAYDPYTFVCYCPTCWSDVMADDLTEQTGAEP